MNDSVTITASHLVLRAGPVQQGDVFEVTKEAAVVVVEEFVEMSVLLGIFVSETILHFNMEDVSLVQNNQILFFLVLVQNPLPVLTEIRTFGFVFAVAFVLDLKSCQERFLCEEKTPLALLNINIASINFTLFLGSFIDWARCLS